MALTLLDGTNAALALTINSLPWQCMAQYVSIDVLRDFFGRNVLCDTGGWRTRKPGLLEMQGRIEGFNFKGVANADPLVLMAASSPTAFVFTLDTGCSYSGNLWASRDHVGHRSLPAYTSEKGLDFLSDGVVSATWVVA